MKTLVIVLAFLIGGTHLSAQWEKILQVDSTQATKIYSVYFEKNLGLFAGGEFSGIYYSSDEGITWQLKGNGTNIAHVKKILPDISNRILILTSRIYFSVDTGNTWQQFFVINPENGQNEVIKNFTYDKPTNNIYAAAESDRLYLSTNNGSNWSSLTHFNYECWCGNNIGSLEVLSEQQILVGTWSYCLDMGGSCYVYNLYKSHNGFSWYQVLHADINFIHAVNENLVLAASKSTLFKSTNLGESWSGLSIGSNIHVINSSQNGIIYLGTENGIYFSSDSSASYLKLTNAGLANTYINDIAIKTEEAIYAAVNDGLYKYPLSPTDINESINSKPAQFVLEQNYPNPFNPETSINFYLPNKSMINISVYNLLGESVGVILNEFMSEGYHKISWVPINLPSGIYIYRLTAYDSHYKKAFSKEKKMIFLK